MNTSDVSQSSARLEVRAASLLTMRAVLIVNAFGLLLIIPILATVALVTLIPYGFWTYAIPVLDVLASLFVLPFAFGNGYLLRLAEPLRAGAPPDAFLVQLNLRPRLHAGARAWLEDADDIGWLSVEGSCLVFRGDSVQLTLPRGLVREVRLENVGWRGLFVYGPRVCVLTSGPGGREFFGFGERSSLLLPQSRRNARATFDALTRWAAARA